jgi:hypothetical protein
MEPTTNLPDVPEAILAYQQAHDRRDVDTALAQFAAEAVVADDGRTYAGLDEIRHFLSSAASEYTYTRSLLNAVEESEGAWLLTNRLEGNFPGGTVDLSYRFRMEADRISGLDIAP